jgi:hypothetical protein
LPKHLLFLQPFLYTYFSHTAKIIQHTFVVFPFFHAEFLDLIAGKFRAESTANRAMLPVANSKLAGVLLSGIAAFAGLFIWGGMHFQSTCHTFLLFLANPAATCPAI